MILWKLLKFGRFEKPAKPEKRKMSAGEAIADWLASLALAALAGKWNKDLWKPAG